MSSIPSPRTFDSDTIRLVWVPAIRYGLDFHQEPMRYGDYLNSHDWKSRRDRFKRDAGGRCQNCGREGERTRVGKSRGHSGHLIWTGLEIHHLHYESLGREETSDILVLCPDCHRTIRRAEWALG